MVSPDVSGHVTSQVKRRQHTCHECHVFLRFGSMGSEEALLRGCAPHRGCRRPCEWAWEVGMQVRTKPQLLTFYKSCNLITYSWLDCSPLKKRSQTENQIDGPWPGLPSRKPGRTHLEKQKLSMFSSRLLCKYKTPQKQSLRDACQMALWVMPCLSSLAA